MSNTDWKRRVSPSSGDSVHITSADTTAFDLDIDVIVVELLELELCNGQYLSLTLGFWTHRLLLEVFVLAQLIDHETFKLVWVRHGYSFLQRVLFFDNASTV